MIRRSRRAEPTIAEQRAAERRAALRRRRRDRGSIGAFVAILAPPIIGLIGLVYDGGLALEGRQRALDLAEQAARAAGNHCDLAVLRERSECVISDAAGARAIADKYMANGVTLDDFYTTDCAPAATDCHTVAVRTRVKVDTLFLGLFGLNQFDIVLPERRATAVTGLA
ncbi:MAG TPA: pilus assembly protein TadG-related protein [Mycobacteriales bacterium]|nr:pilus assembly protein TadG-related protein [Mycobacteriales bacterium]